MVKHITQQTFDDVVKENINDFEMAVEEAIQDAVKQFESQGVNLSNIIKDPSLYSATSENLTSSEGGISLHPVIAAIQKMKVHLDCESSVDASLIMFHLDTINKECNLDLAHRCLAGTNGAYPVLIKTVNTFSGNVIVIKSTLQSLCALMNGQPDLLDEEGCTRFVQFLQEFKDSVEILEIVVRLVRLCCLKHEANRQMFVDKKLIQALSDLLKLHHSVPTLVKEICIGLRALTLDDDIRVPFGKAHDHAKMIVTEGDALKAILKICEVYTEDVGVLGELFLTLGNLAVRNEFCQEVLDLAGVDLILRAFENNIADKSIVRQALTVLRALTGNDEIKVAVVRKKGVELLLNAMNRHASNVAVAEAACAVLASLILRNPSHCDKVMQCRGHEAVLQVMKIHDKESSVQKQACLALRNLVARTREYSPAILGEGAEELLNQAASMHADCADEAKAALRDLGCKVHFKELWTGQKGSIAQ